MIRAKYEPSPVIGEPSGDGIVTSWDVASDLSKITFKIRKGVQFHGGWGEVAAEDVAFSWNQMLSEGSTFARVGEWGQWVERVDALDPSTAVLVVKPGAPIYPTWPRDMSNLTGGPPIVSKKAYDQLGEDKMIVTEAGTGPFQVKSWVANQEARLEAVENHWRQTPHVQEVRIREMKESSTMLAAFRVGEIHICMPPLKDLKKLLNDTGGRAQDVGLPAIKEVTFAGNYWMKTNQDTGEPVERRPGFLPDAAHPWIGDPDDTARMESARKVRWAMSMVVDRDAINEKLLDGFGLPGYSVVGFSVNDPLFKQDWVVPYDIDEAQQLLKDAGYGGGFKTGIYVPPDVPAVVTPAMGEAVAQMWRDNLGLDVTIDSTAYTARRPTMVARSIDIPFMWNRGPVHMIDKFFGDGARVTAGWNHGIEIQVIAEGFNRNLRELDYDKRVQNNIEIQDYVTHWQIYLPIVEQPGLCAVRPEVVEWTPWVETAGYFGSFETAVLK
jgi:peptide/nickel transport system substrate-binding protein